MNFVAQLEDYLRDLGAEARKKHPGVKEASERAILKLRSLQNDYVGGVRKASANGEKHPSTTIFRSSDLLHPFLLAANYPNASPKLLDTSFKAMKTLMEADAICPGDGMNLVRVWMIQAQVVVSYSTKDNSSGTPQTTIGGGSKSTIAASNLADFSTRSSTSGTSQSTGSWLGGFLTSSTSTTTKSMTNAVSTKTAVSSSHGQAGLGHLNAKDLEKLALDILSCLLQLLELRDLPVTNEQWIQSVTLCCLLYLPSRQTVRQAAHSTLPQVLTLLVKDDNAKDLAVSTWEDLLTCTLGLPHAVSSSTLGSSKQNQSILQGAFSHCRTGEKGAAQPPSPSLSLDLMATLLREAPFVFSQVGQKTLGVVVQILQSQSSNASTLPTEYVRTLQFVLVVLQTQAKDWPTECRELVVRLGQPIPRATEALRKQAEFEDGFIYKVHNKDLLPSTASLDSLRGLPPTILWKAALSMDTLKALIHDKSLRAIWMDTTVLTQSLEAMSDFCTIGASCEDHMNLVVLACRKKEHSLAFDAESLTSMDLWKKGKTKEDTYVLGEVVWTGLNTILKIIENLDDTTLDHAFAPSLAVLQHYLKRFPASGTIVKRALEGYFLLSKVSLRLPLIRRALLTSLCKLSLPQWGTHDPTCLLRDHNIAALICLLNVVHRFYDSIGPEWSIVLQTFQELSVLPIASPHLSDSAYVGALSISAVYSRFASFSTCLSDASLAHFVEALREVSQFEQTPNIMSSPLGGSELLSVPNKSGDGASKEERETIGKSLMSIGVRAIYGGSTDSSNAQHEDVPLTERTKNRYSHDYQSEFGRRVAGSKHPMRVNQVPFTFSLLVDVAMANSFRSSDCGATIYRSLCGLASDVPSVRNFSMDAVAMLIMSNLADDPDFPITFIGPGEIVYSDPRQNQYLAVEVAKTTTPDKAFVSQEALLAPLCQCIRDVKSAIVADAGVESLHAILESCGHDLNTEAWTIVIQAVASLPSEERSSGEWSNSCLIGFRCLKLIVDDFAALTDASTAALTSLLDCCSSFGSSQHDVNTSLTAIGLLWTIADQDAGTASIDRALSKLVVLCSDTRAEVRNCAVNTFFSCIAGRGQAFTNDQWRSCLCDMVFPVFDKVAESISNGEEPTSNDTDGKKSRYTVSVHHSRDSAGKQWIATQSLVLRGLCRVLRSFFSKFLDTMDDGSGVASTKDDTPWFEDAWNKVLGYAFDAATQVGGRDTLELRTAGSELLVLSCQLSCKEGIHAAITPARVGTNMEVVNGALRSVRSPDRDEASNRDVPRHSHSIVTEMWRENLFLDAFDVLDSIREHLESDASNHNESGLHHTLEPTQVQVLSKFSEAMGKLYECCKDDEFVEDRTFDTVEDFDELLTFPRTRPGEGDPLVIRFVQIIATVAMGSAGGPDARFLSQAQRSCIDILRTMASDGSPEALLTLVELSSQTMFLEREANGKAKQGVDILSHEAAVVLEEAFSKDCLSNETRVLVTHHMLRTFLDEHDPALENVDLSYKLLVSVAMLGLQSARKLQDKLAQSGSPKAKLLDGLWEQMLVTLNRVLTPIFNEQSEALTIPNSPNLVELLIVAAEMTPPNRRDDMCRILATGSSKCLRVTIDIDINNDNPLQQEEALKLFSVCLGGVCRIDAKNSALQTIAEEVLTSTLAVVSEKTLEDLLENIQVQACLTLCRTIQECEGADLVAIAVFPQLCQLMGTELTELRRAVGGILAKVDVGNAIVESDALRLSAEERAVVAEIKVVELTKEVAKLREEKEALERQLALI